MSIITALFMDDSPVSVQRVYSSHGTGTETIPSGVNTLVAEVWGATGFSGHGAIVGGEPQQGGGAGSGGYARTSISVGGHSGQTMTWTVGQANTSNSTVVSGTFTITTMTGPLGGNGVSRPGSGAGGAAGATGTGGTVTNLPGNPGKPGDPNDSGVGGAGVIGINGTGPAGPNGTYTGVNGPGRDGLIIFNYM